MLIEFAGYAGDCRVTGTMEMDGERLTDVLNEEPTLLIHDAVVESLVDGRTVHLDEIALQRDEVLAVEAAGPRGPIDRRIHTVRHRLQVRIGPYSVLAQIHAMPGAPPLSRVGRRGQMVPLTEATIGYMSGGMLRMHDTQTLIVNRELAQWLPAPMDDRQAFADMPVLEGEPL